MDKIFHVVYSTYGAQSARCEAYVRVCEGFETNARYYATDMGVQLALYPANPHSLGCGKNAATPEGAVHLLVSDHGVLLRCTEV